MAHGTLHGVKHGVVHGDKHNQLVLGSNSNTTLSVALTDNADPVMSQSAVIYSCVVTNTGANSATAITCTIVLDASLTFVSANGTGWSIGNVGNTITATLGTLAAGTPANTITVNATTGNSTLTASNTGDASASNAPAATQSVQTTSVLLVSKDATSGIRCPASGTEWTNLMTLAGLVSGNPGSLWLMQEASGSLADSIGSVTLSQLGTGHLYAQSVTGWSRKAATCVDGTANQRWGNSTTAPDPSLTSVLYLAWIRMPASSAPAATRDIMGGPNNLEVKLTTTPRLQAVDTTNTGTAVNSPVGATRPVLLKLDRTNSACTMYTDQEKVTVTYAAGVSAGALVHFGGQSTGAADVGYLYGCEFSGSNAEISDANVKTLLQTAGWTIPWT